MISPGPATAPAPASAPSTWTGNIIHFFLISSCSTVFECSVSIPWLVPVGRFWTYRVWCFIYLILFLFSFRPLFNASPGSDLPVVRRDDESGGGEVVLQCMKWGLIPSFTEKSEKPNYFKMVIFPLLSFGLCLGVVWSFILKWQLLFLLPVISKHL